MPTLGLMELALIGIVALVVVGPERLPHATRWLGRTYGRLRRAANELQRALMMEADRLDEEERLKKLKAVREDEARKRKEREEAPEEGGDEGGPMSQPAPFEPPPAPEPEEVIPAGYTASEWAEVPEHVKELVRRRQPPAEPS